MSDTASWELFDGRYAYEPMTETPPDYEALAADYADSLKPVTEFDLESYLEVRATTPSFAFVEIGHRKHPIAFQIPDLTGQRTYVGIESWLRDSNPYTPYRYIVDGLQQRAEGSNAVFQYHDIGGNIVYDPDDECYERSWVSGEYNTETILPDGAADELFLGNLFGDPQFTSVDGSGSVDRREPLLDEAVRLLAPDGTIVLRESITPREAKIDRATYAEYGLVPVGFYNPTMPEEWAVLEATYIGDVGALYHYSDYYLFLAAEA